MVSLLYSEPPCRCSKDERDFSSLAFSRRRQTFFYYYYDVVNGTTTKAELWHIVRHTKTYLHRDAGTTLGCKSLHFSLFKCAAIRKLQINKMERFSRTERRSKQFQLNPLMREHSLTPIAGIKKQQFLVILSPIGSIFRTGLVSRWNCLMTK